MHLIYHLYPVPFILSLLIGIYHLSIFLLLHIKLTKVRGKKILLTFEKQYNVTIGFASVLIQNRRYSTF